MATTKFKLEMIPSFNNGRSGGKEYWVVYLDGEDSKPYIGETLDSALAFIKERAEEQPPF